MKIKKYNFKQKLLIITKLPHFPFKTIPLKQSLQAPFVLQVLECLEFSSALWVPFQGPSRIKGLKNCQQWITSENFSNFSENMVCITLIVDCSLRNKMCKFYHVLLTRYNHPMFKGVSKTIKYDEFQSSFLGKVVVLQL